MLVNLPLSTFSFCHTLVGIIINNPAHKSLLSLIRQFHHLGYYNIAVKLHTVVATLARTYHSCVADCLPRGNCLAETPRHLRCSVLHRNDLAAWQSVRSLAPWYDLLRLSYHRYCTTRPGPRVTSRSGNSSRTCQIAAVCTGSGGSGHSSTSS